MYRNSLHRSPNMMRFATAVPPFLRAARAAAAAQWQWRQRRLLPTHRSSIHCGCRATAGDSNISSSAAAATVTERQARLEKAKQAMRDAHHQTTAAPPATTPSSPTNAAATAAAAKATAAEDAEYSRALTRSMRLVNFRERGAVELSERLVSEGFHPRAAVRAVRRLQELGLQDDARFAAMYARGRWRTGLRAPAAIARELRAKGVSDADAAAALEACFGPGGKLLAPPAPPGYGAARHHGNGDGDGCGDDDDNGDEGGAWRELVAQARRRAELSAGEDVHKRRGKLARWLAYRGHAWDTIKRVMREVGL